MALFLWLCFDAVKTGALQNLEPRKRGRLVRPEDLFNPRYTGSGALNEGSSSVLTATRSEIPGECVI
jgi:hypothetical protein